MMILAAAGMKVFRNRLNLVTVQKDKERHRISQGSRKSCTVTE